MAQIISDLVEDRRNRVLGEAAEERAEECGRPGGGERDRKWEEPNGVPVVITGWKMSNCAAGHGAGAGHGALRSLDGRAVQ